MAAIYLIRHGQASFHSDNYDKLSPTGIQQSKQLGTALHQRGIRFDAVYAGSMVRHAQTAQHCMSNMGFNLTPAIIEGFNEYNHEEVLEKHRPEFAERDALNRFLAAQNNPRKAFQIEFESALHRWRGGEFDHEYSENWAQFITRCNAAMDQVRSTCGEAKSIAVFSSGGPISVATGQCLGLADSHIAELSWSLMNCSITCLLFNSEKITLRYFNDFAHFEVNADKSMLTYR
ncbi:histidine phosphatase family protein [Ketobacter sp. MCCC 1A13808]|uniref:histidine phosphatase family protein n=1 Tax=Ketobacter sp. MCCC 1A13808 TaxID=2602738 RepID=UPI000F2AE0F9|nr:histidine phosphatase family protein [Ketobacter sp. MCCC 1A13808]MVF14534.1 histidine phosphatase family protein [Ketobacter sp. MCCC 1A13808]RLP54147.1 MAG: histidine phosphatase family protein [Ketobacter sp.]